MLILQQTWCARLRRTWNAWPGMYIEPRHSAAEPNSPILKHKTSKDQNVRSTATIRWCIAIDAFACASFDPSEELGQSVDEALVQPDERSCQSLPIMPLFCGRDYEEAGLLEH
ncbi:hypothetical protein FOCG_08918 [Fusarium oxysporum f. sp. radicis-lycopersici 26381]|uniref:Uncharacterized protein n=1 Tax=Fusarium oxysporum Fo47 TaxID=660027 RepID=W9K8S4_FUSOX|nr:hypothetical protein FOZG_08324 [Fusarium oxysporum Fo47]EWZ83900.1 hypothetical protein FOWG_12780 [Fusarium oxysporum f. sp. lycopersici MN25]EXL50694.1 hypothetical protein FOCG_08918 [Fusarium oxysporum f. sp. radicis-lycopersici 26381]KAJ0146917.1 Uncharacterized protein HZ326_10443 [Fusarium oxysporum f. sp. albedinis]